MNFKDFLQALNCNIRNIDNIDQIILNSDVIEEDRLKVFKMMKELNKIVERDPEVVCSDFNRMMIIANKENIKENEIVKEKIEEIYRNLKNFASNTFDNFPELTDEMKQILSGFVGFGCIHNDIILKRVNSVLEKYDAVLDENGNVVVVVDLKGE